MGGKYFDFIILSLVRIKIVRILGNLYFVLNENKKIFYIIFYGGFMDLVI